MKLREKKRRSPSPLLVLGVACGIMLLLFAAFLIYSGGELVVTDYSYVLSSDVRLGTRVIPDSNTAVKAIDINWPCGNVYIIEWSRDDMLFYEHKNADEILGSAELEDIAKAHMGVLSASPESSESIADLIDGDLVFTATVERDTENIMRSGKRPIGDYWYGIYACSERSGFGAMKDVGKKDLYIAMPQDQFFYCARIEADGCVIKGAEFTDYLTVSSCELGITLEDVSIKGALTAGSDFGDVTLENVGFDSLLHSSFSGDLTLSSVTARSIEASSLSGDMSAHVNSCEAFSFDSYTGSLEFVSESAQESFYFESISGNCSVQTTAQKSDNYRMVTAFGKTEFKSYKP